MSQQENSIFCALLCRSIYSILDGDSNFGTYNNVPIQMPYLSGPRIVEISNLFQYNEVYQTEDGVLSRWQYMDRLLRYGIENNKIQKIISFLFSKKQFMEILIKFDEDEINSTYSYIINKIISEINKILFIGDSRLYVSGDIFYISSINSNVLPICPNIKNIDFNYIKSISDRALEDIRNKNFDSSLTKSRTLLEEVFFYGIEKKNQVPPSDGNINKMWGNIKQLYGIKEESTHDKRINDLINGLGKIISSIGDMRNKDSDAHAAGSKRINIAEHHARLCVNASTVVADFVLAVIQRQLSN